MASSGEKPKKRSRKQPFMQEYKEKWHFIKESAVDAHHACCTYCNQDFMIGHGGSYDITLHIQGKKTSKKRSSSEQ